MVRPGIVLKYHLYSLKFNHNGGACFCLFASSLMCQNIFIMLCAAVRGGWGWMDSELDIVNATLSTRTIY